MKRTLSRSAFILIIALLFLGGISAFVIRYASSAEKWADMPYNGHLSNDVFSRAGTVYDRYGAVLAYTEDGERHYNEDESVRVSTLHIVGDTSFSISTAVQSTYSASLRGYNALFGFGLPLKSDNTGDIKLTVDSSACAAAYDALGGRKGAVVVFNYKTGEILCSVSTPSPIKPATCTKRQP